MAQVTEKAHQKIEKLLTVSRTNWERLPEVEAEIGNWDPDDAEVFILEWSIEEDRLDRLEELAGQGAMTKDQAARYEELKKLVTKNRPIIERLADR